MGLEAECRLVAHGLKIRKDTVKLHGKLPFGFSSHCQKSSAHSGCRLRLWMGSGKDKGLIKKLVAVLNSGILRLGDQISISASVLQLGKCAL